MASNALNKLAGGTYTPPASSQTTSRNTATVKGGTYALNKLAGGTYTPSEPEKTSLVDTLNSKEEKWSFGGKTGDEAAEYLGLSGEAYSSLIGSLDELERTRSRGGTSEDWYKDMLEKSNSAKTQRDSLQAQLKELQRMASAGTWEYGVYMGESHEYDDQIADLKEQLKEADKQLSYAQNNLSHAEQMRYEDLYKTAGYNALGQLGQQAFEKDREAQKAAQPNNWDIYMSDNAGAAAIQLTYDAFKNDTSYREPQDNWTQEQKNNFYYLYQRDRDEAYAYGQRVNDTLAAKTRYEEEQKVAEWASKNVLTGAAATAANLVTAPLSIADMFTNAAEYAARGTITQKEEMTLTDYGNVMTAAVAQTLNKKYGIIDEDKTLIGGMGVGDAYQVGLSILQSMTYGHALGSTGAAMTFFGMGAKSGYEEAVLRGATPEQALTYGLTSGLAESLGEALSVEHLLTIKTPSTLKGMLKNILTQGGIEASEEAMTTLMNTVTDAWVMGDKSSINTATEEYILLGMSREEASNQAMKDWLKDVGVDALTGFISGSVSGGIETTIQGSRRYQGDTQQLFENAMRTPEGSQARMTAEKYVRMLEEDALAIQAGRTAASAARAVGRTASNIGYKIGNRVFGEGWQQPSAAYEQQRGLENKVGTAGGTKAAEESQIKKKETPKRKLTRLHALRLSEQTAKAEISSRLDAKGVKYDEKMLNALVKATVSGDELSKKEQKLVSDTKIQEAITEMRQNAECGLRWDYGENTAKFPEPAANGEQRSVENKNAQVTVDGKEQKLEGMTYENGELLLRTGGTWVAANTVELPKDVAELVEAFAPYRDSAAAMFAAYENGQDIDQYISAWLAAENLYGASTDATREQARRGLSPHALTNTQLVIAFEKGRDRRTAAKREAEKAKAEEKLNTPEKTERKKGKVSYEGGVIAGKEYKAVDRSKLSAAQKKQIKAIHTLAEKLGINFVLYESEANAEGRLQGANGIYTQDTIFLDVNAGANYAGEVGQIGKTAIIRTATHELTHFIQDKNAEQYEALKDFLLNNLTEYKGREVSDIVNEKIARSGSTLSYEAALDEVVADGCEMMLQRTEVMHMLAERERSLWKDIQRWLKSWVKRLEAAFEGVEAVHDEAKAMVDHAKELQKLWDEALAGAVTGEKITASEGGQTKYSINPDFAAAIDAWNGKREITFNVGTTSKALQDIGIKDQGIIWHSAKISRILREHTGMTRDVIKQVPNILENPVIVVQSKNKDSRIAVFGEVYDSNGALVTAILELQPTNEGGQVLGLSVIASAYGKDTNPAGFIRSSGLLYLDPEIGRTKRWLQGLGLQLPSDTIPLGSVGRISYPDGKVKIESVPFTQYMQSSGENTVQFQERDIYPTERELLLDAGRKKDAPAEVKRYRNKYNELARLNRKLTALKETKPTEERGEEDIKAETALVEKRIAKAEEQLRQMEASGPIQKAAEAALAEWRKLNDAEVARTLRLLNEENERLRRRIEHLGSELKLTGEGEQRANPEDVRALAKSILSEYDSSLDLQFTADNLQMLADYIVSNASGEGIDYKVLNQMARSIAEQVVKNVFITDDSNADTYNELRSYLQSTTLKISGELRGEATEGVKRLRNKYFGRINLANEGRDIDSAYQELGVIFGEGLFPTSITAHYDQLEIISDALDTLAPKQFQAYGRGERIELMTLLGSDIVDRLISGEVRQRQTLADREYSRIAARVQDLNEEVAALKHADEQLRREEIGKKVKELRERSIERDKAYKARKRIEQKVKRLSKMLTENSGKKHVTEGLKEPLANFLSSIDTLSSRSGEKARTAYAKRLSDLAEVILTQQSFSKEGSTIDLPFDLGKELGTHKKDFEAAAEGSKGYTLVYMTSEELGRLEDILNILSRSIETADELFSGERSRAVAEVARPTLEHLEEMKPRKRRKKAMQTTETFLQEQNTTPYYWFKRFGEGGKQIFKSLQDGWAKLAFLGREIVDFANKAYTGEFAKEAETTEYTFKLSRRLLDKDGKTARDANGEVLRSEKGEEVTMTKAQLMSLYALSKRPQALGHILGAGIRINDYKDKKGNIVTQADHYLVSIQELYQMIDTLSAQDKEIVDKLQKYLSTTCSQWGNEISMKRWGIRAYTENNYWPIKTDSNQHDARTPDADRANMFRILNQSFTKSVTQDANNALVLDSAFDVFANHAADMAKYNALGLPLLDAMKWYNYREQGEKAESGQYVTESLQQTIERTFGRSANNYFTTLMQDLNGNNEGGRGEDFASKALSNYKIGSVGANLRVAWLQFSSIVRAGAVLNPKYIGRGLSGQRLQDSIDEAQKYSGEAVWKKLGFFDTNVNANLRELIKHTETKADKLRNKSMVFAEKADEIVWGILWNACKTEMRETKGLSGEELIKATQDRFQEVIYATQVMDSTLTRSHIMRQPGAFAGMVTSFMSEPTLSYNLLLDAYNSIRYQMRRGDNFSTAWQKHSDTVQRAIVSYIMSSVASGILGGFWDAWRDDDEYESFAEKWLDAFGENLLSDLNPLGKLPVFRDFVSLLQGYDVERMDMQGVSQLVNVVNIWKETMQLSLGLIDEPTDITYNGNMTSWGKVYETLKAFSQLSGIPMANATRDVSAIWNTLLGQRLDWEIHTYDSGPKGDIKFALLDGYLTEEEAIEQLIAEGIYEDRDDAYWQVDSWQTGDNKFDGIINAALAKDMATFEAEAAELLEHGVKQSSINSEIRTSIREAYQGTEEKPRTISKEEAIALLQEYGGMRERAATQTVQEWTSLVSEGIAYDEIKTYFIDGELSAEEAVELRMRYGNQLEAEARETVLQWQCEKDTGIAYGDIQEEYVEGYITAKEAVNLRVTYGGYDVEAAESQVLKWQCEKDTGIEYNDIQLYFVAGEISGAEVVDMLMQYGEKEEAEAEAYLAKYEFVGDNLDINDISVTAVGKYNEFVEPTGISGVDFYDYWKSINGIDSERDENGDIVTNAQKLRWAYIDSLNLTVAQKDALHLVFYAEKSLRRAPWH